MMSAQTGWAAIWGVNASFLRMAAAGAIGWGCWEASAARGFELLAYIAVVAAIVVIKHGAIGSYRLTRLIFGARKWARYRRQGAAPKADHMASEARLRTKGLM